MRPDLKHTTRINHYPTNRSNTSTLSTTLSKRGLVPIWVEIRDVEEKETKLSSKIRWYPLQYKYDPHKSNNSLTKCHLLQMSVSLPQQRVSIRSFHQSCPFCTSSSHSCNLQSQYEGQEGNLSRVLELSVALETPSLGSLPSEHELDLKAMTISKRTAWFSLGTTFSSS